MRTTWILAAVVVASTGCRSARRAAVSEAPAALLPSSASPCSAPLATDARAPVDHVTPSDAPWTSPDCYGYAASKRSYACLAFSVGADSYEESAPVPVDRFRPDPGVSWYGHEAIELVGPSPRTIEIARKEYDRTSTLVRARSEADARALANAEGFARTEIIATALPADTWLDVGRVALRFETALDEHAASAAYGSSLTLRCAPSAPATELAAGSNGEIAVAFRAASADEIVVGLREWTGGEGSGYYDTRYVYVDPSAYCPRDSRRAARVPGDAAGAVGAEPTARPIAK